MAENVMEFNDQNFDSDVLKAEMPVLVDFWAVWCGPCIATFPHLREWHDKYADKGFEIIGYTSYYKRYDWKDGKLIRLQTPKPKLPIKRK